MERTLLILKPDALGRRLVGRIVSRIEEKGFKIVALKMMRIDNSLAAKQYDVHKGKDFYRPLVEFMTSGPVVAMVVEGVSAISVMRDFMGPTFGPDAPGGTIRGDFGLSRRHNLIHGSDSAKAAAKEIPLFFRPEEIMDYALPDEALVYAWKDGQRI
jgi:nucleoside-diphosphate kinase